MIFIFSFFIINTGNYGNARVLQVVSVYDGDTFKANLKDLPSIIGYEISIRIKGIDTPELKANNIDVKSLAYKARDYTRSQLTNANIIILSNIERGMYFRIIADVWYDNTNLASNLIKYKYALPSTSRCNENDFIKLLK